MIYILFEPDFGPLLPLASFWHIIINHAKNLQGCLRKLVNNNFFGKYINAALYREKSFKIYFKTRFIWIRWWANSPWINCIALVLKFKTKFVEFRCVKALREYSTSSSRKRFERKPKQCMVQFFLKCASGKEQRQHV